MVVPHSKGSVVADSVFEFDNTNNTSPNVTEVTNTFTEAVKTGNFSFSVDETSINVTDITTSGQCVFTDAFVVVVVVVVV